MSTKQQALTAEQASRLGSEIYERKVLPTVTEEQNGMVVAIDLLSGEFALAGTALEASRQLRIHCPKADVWLARIGQHALDRIGAAGC
jgi:hypothetical protein